MTPFQHVLVATDGSPNCELAVRTAIDLCAAIGARLTVVSVVPQLPGDADLDSATDPLGAAEEGIAALRRGDPDAPMKAAGARTSAACEKARASGVRAECVVYEGSAAKSIVAAADAVGADLVIVGSHARGGVGRMVLGSVSDHVVRNAHIPVMVVRPDARTSAT